MDGFLTNDEAQNAQTERTERAISALSAGRFQVMRVGSQQWTVQNGDKQPYAVTFFEDTWACTCMDFHQRGPQVRCKHIEGVRLSEAAQNQTIHKENQMEQTQSLNKENLNDRLGQIVWELRQPLDMSRVKRRQAPGSGSVPYLEGYDVIERANAIFGFAWSFDLIGEPMVVRWHKKVLVWNQQEKRKVSLIDADGTVQTEEVGLVYITGKVSVELDGRLYSHADLGRCIFTGDTPEALDMALAGSATDCLKRCFRQLGEQFGNCLYDKEIAQNAGLEQGRENGASTSSSTQSTQRSAAPVVRKYGDGTSVNGNASEQEAYDQYKKAKGTPPASKETLRTWLSSQHASAVPASVAA